ncbi:MAG: nitroreductase family protein [Anaerolineae bacterium]
MDTLTTIFERRSVRTYKQEPIPDADLKQILEAGHQAPSAANRQPWHFVVVGDPAQKAQVAQACNNQMWMAEASYILVAVGRPPVSEKWFKVDVAIALQSMVLAARSLGYGTCWIGAFADADVRAVCHIPDDLTVVACTPLGVPDVDPPARQRKPWDEVFSRDRFGDPLKI